MVLISHFLSRGCGREAGEVKRVGTPPGLQPLCILCRCRQRGAFQRSGRAGGTRWPAGRRCQSWPPLLTVQSARPHQE